MLRQQQSRKKKNSILSAGKEKKKSRQLQHWSHLHVGLVIPPVINAKETGEATKKITNNLKSKKAFRVIFCAVGSCDAPICEDKAAAIVERRKAGAPPPISRVFGKVHKPSLAPAPHGTEHDRTKNKKTAMDGTRIYSLPPEKTHQLRCAIYFFPYYGEIGWKATVEYWGI